MSVSHFQLPARVYPIIDTLGDPTRSHYELAAQVLAAGARLLQLRVKGTSTRRICELARAVQALAAGCGAILIVNDRTDIALAAGAGGVHLGQEDLPAEAARQILGSDRIIGWSTHSIEQAVAAERAGAADYIGFGPIFATRSKENPDPVQGLNGLRQVRAITRLPLVAIGGITGETMADVLTAGADAVAMIGAICGASNPGAAFADLLSRAG